jgi:N-methylhydantoinase A/oxoprolinase/acetone carboxylase beta subunit
MLSKEVKRRRRIKRLVRSQPAWRICMQALKQTQLNLLKLNHNSSYGAHSPGKWADAQPATTAYYARALDLKKQMKEMTREEFFEEMEKTHPQAKKFSMRLWAEQIIAGKVARDMEEEKMQKKFRRAFGQQPQSDIHFGMQR